MHRTLSRLAASQPTVRSRLTPNPTGIPNSRVDLSEISDSEPEREGRRQEEKENRKRRKHHHHIVQCHRDGIELTDSQEPALTQLASQVSQVPPTTQSVISIHDDSSEAPCDLRTPGKGFEHGQTYDAHNEDIIEISDGTGDNSSICSVPGLTKRVESLEYNEPPIDIPRPITDPSDLFRASAERDDSDDEQSAGLNLRLKSFAYAGSLKERSRNPSSTSASGSGSIVSFASTQKQIRCASKAQTILDEFAQSDLARLLKCVSCELTWTTRKSVTQKLKHIRACAKKKSLTDSTVAFLLRSELAVVPPLPEKNAGAAEKAQEPGTLLETWTDGTNKRRTKRRTVPDTVRSLADTRGQILDKARAVLGQPAPGPNRSTEPAKDGPRVRDEDAHMPPPTQVFGESALAKNGQLHQELIQPIAFASTQLYAPSESAISKTTSTSTAHEDDIDMPHPTQLFAPSRLATSTGTSESQITAARPASSSANAASPAYPQTDPVHIDWHSPSDLGSRFHVDSESPYRAEMVNVEYDDHPEGWSLDNAYLHFYPEDVGHAGLDTQSRPVSPTTGPSCWQQTKHTDASRANTQGADAIATMPAPTSEPRKKPRSRKGKQPTLSSPVKESLPEITEAEFESRLHEAIMKDNSLHLRIIRYEPVHFDVFMRLATDAGLVQARKLGLIKGRVRTFLDKLAIHFHGVDGPGGDRARKRHP